MSCYPTTTDWGVFPVAELTPQVRATAENLAWETLAALTGARLSLCPITVRPGVTRLRLPTWHTAPASSIAGELQGSQWYSGCGCGDVDICACTGLIEVTLPGVVGEITEVRVNGFVIDSLLYRVDNGNRLVREDGLTWPVNDDPSLGMDCPGSFSVTYLQGYPPEALLNFAAGQLAVEFAEAVRGRECKLPSGVTQITRQGVSMQISTGMFSEGTTGLREVDAIIRIYNPHSLTVAARVLSPDSPRHRTSTWRK